MKKEGRRKKEEELKEIKRRGKEIPREEVEGRRRFFHSASREKEGKTLLKYCIFGIGDNNIEVKGG